MHFRHVQDHSTAVFVVFGALAVIVMNFIAAALMFGPRVTGDSLTTSETRQRLGIASILNACIIVGLLRMFVPGKDVFSWEGTYEFVAHFLLGVLVTLAVVSPLRRWYIAFFILLTLWEGFMFWHQGHRVTGWTW